MAKLDISQLKPHACYSKQYKRMKIYLAASKSNFSPLQSSPATFRCGSLLVTEETRGDPMVWITTRYNGKYLNYFKCANLPLLPTCPGLPYM